MTSTDFKPGDRVSYIPFAGSEEREYGAVSSTTAKYVFVRFDKHVKRFGWKGTTGQACLPEDLQKVNQ